jgi:hypothetical protein
LFSLGFAMPETADAVGDASAFVFVVPAEPGWEAALASITLTGPDGSFTLDGDSDIPMAILRDSRNGQVRALLRDWPSSTTQAAMSAAGQGAGTGFQTLFSLGIPDADAWRR